MYIAFVVSSAARIDNDIFFALPLIFCFLTKETECLIINLIESLALLTTKITVFYVVHPNKLLKVEDWKSMPLTVKWLEGEEIRSAIFI